jgi:hypothetical protein
MAPLPQFTAAIFANLVLCLVLELGMGLGCRSALGTVLVCGLGVLVQWYPLRAMAV